MCFWCVALQTRQATREELLLVHDEAHLRDMEQLCTSFGTDQLTDDLKYKLAMMEKKDSVYIHPQSYKCASLATGSVLQVWLPLIMKNYNLNIHCFQCWLYVIFEKARRPMHLYYVVEQIYSSQLLNLLLNKNKVTIINLITCKNSLNFNRIDDKLPFNLSYNTLLRLQVDNTLNRSNFIEKSMIKSQLLYFCCEKVDTSL